MINKRFFNITQKDKLQFAIATMKQVADSLRRDAKDFDCTFPLTQAISLTKHNNYATNNK